ncbi:P-loop containing nucleoside triphosphate hydrolase protein [Cubamyces menziesii]|nr:P-loop containing nucleoside triphosphate hydrolase protein [Cubamyces menziesii]
MSEIGSVETFLSTDGDEAPLAEGVGLSSAEHAAARRKMLDVVNALHLTGVQVDIDLPIIAAIGQQSAGKSSLIEAISGITLPRAGGTCTRSPTECRLSYSKDAWKCIVSLRILTDLDGKALGQPDNIVFGDPIYNKSEVEERVRRAQRAILSPSVPHDAFLANSEGKLPPRELSFSTNAVCLQISGPDVQDLSFCDLPGLIASVGSAGSADDIALVRNLASTCIARPSCLVLLTVACETDFQNQGAHQLAKTYDPEGQRTIGVLTKPDRIPSGEEDGWLRYIRNQSEPLTHGWFSVKQPDSRALSAGITWEEARESERHFFLYTAPWNQLDLEYQNRLGTYKLVERLSDLLSDKIRERLPGIQEELQDLLGTTDAHLEKLPKPPSSDALSEVLHLISTFCKGLSQLLEGAPEKDGLLQSIRPVHEAFHEAIRSTEPDFRPYERQFAERNPGEHKYIYPPFLASEESAPYKPKDNSHAIFIDEVMDRARQAITRELPHHYPFVITQQYIGDFVAQWKKPYETLFREIQRVLIKHIKKFVSDQFSQYPNLMHRVHTIVGEYISSSSDATLDQLQLFLALEKRPKTLSEPYYSDYREKFISHYKSCRPKADQPRETFASKLQSYMDPQSDMSKYMNRVLNGLTDIGLPGMTPNDLAKLLPADPHDTAIDIMAGVRAYFQVAYRRFCDNIANMIDHKLVLGLDRGQALEKALRAGLGIGSPDVHARCKEYIQEPRQIADRREELMKRRERLETARRQLSEAWI